MESKLEWLASNLLFSTNVKIDESLAHCGLEYRKGKTVGDVLKAREKAIKNGMQKTEYELNMLQVYLKSVFKHSTKEVEK